MSLKLPLGIDDFRQVRALGLLYVDKTHLVRELLDMPGAQVVLLPRPRRFGKSLNLSMLRCFFEKRDEDLSGAFAGLSIAEAGEEYLRHFQRYPVIHLTFKGAKLDTFEACWASLAKKIEVLFREHRHVLDSGLLSEGRGSLRVVGAVQHPCDECPGTMDLPVLGKTKFCLYLTASCSSGGGVTCCEGEIGACVSDFTISQIDFSVCWS